MDALQTVNIDKFNVLFNHYSEKEKINFWTGLGISYNTDKRSHYLLDYVRANRHFSGCIMSIFLSSTLSAGLVSF
jgi:hypothetical protein